MSVSNLPTAFCENIIVNMEQCQDRIRHCVGQLTGDQLWWRSAEAMNSIGNILLHVCGNMTQWIINGVPEKEDVRNRPGEFATRDQIPTAQLLEQLSETIGKVKIVLARLTELDLLQPRRIQGFEETILSAIAHSSHHLAGHTQEITYITRLQLGDAYRFAWTPTTKEEGA